MIKKIFALLLASGLYTSFANANTLTIFNTTGCTYTVHTINDGVIHTVPPGTYTTASAPGIQDYWGVRFAWNGAPTSYLSLSYTGSTFATSSSVGVFPTCTNPSGNAFNASWAQGSPTGNITMVIFS